MGWEYRKGKPYFYRKERQGNRVISTYCGPVDSDQARLWSSVAAFERAERQQAAAQARQARAEFAELASTPAELADLLSEAKRATADALQAAGYRQHDRGQWRKQRGNKNQNQVADEAP